MSQARVDPILPSDEDAMLARTALERSEALDQGLQLQIATSGRESVKIDLPAVVVRLLKQILRETADGRAVSLVTIEEEITTQQAADLLNVSRPYLIGLVRKGFLPVRKVGNQRRLPLRDVLAYKAENRAKRHAIVDEMGRLDQELGLI